MSNAAKAKEFLFRFASSDACNEFTDSVCQLGSSIAILVLTDGELAGAFTTEATENGPENRILMGAMLVHAGLNTIEDHGLRDKVHAWVNKFISEKKSMAWQSLDEESTAP